MERSIKYNELIIEEIKTLNNSTDIDKIITDLMWAGRDVVEIAKSKGVDSLEQKDMYIERIGSVIEALAYISLMSIHIDRI